MLDSRRIKQRGLRLYYETANPKGIRADWVAKVRRILQALDAATDPSELSGIPSFHNHALKGNRKGTWSATIQGNWRITYKWRKDEGPYDVNMEDYHGK